MAKLKFGDTGSCPAMYKTQEFIGIPREVKNGVFQKPSENFTFTLPSNATDIGNQALQYAFENCTALTSVDLSSLTTISGSNAFYIAFRNCTGLTSVNLSSLTTILNSATRTFSYAFSGCTALTSIDLSSLTTIVGSKIFNYAFQDCTSLSSLSFPALTTESFGPYRTDQFDYMLFGVSKCTVHFPFAIKSIIEYWSSVQDGFGGTNTTVLFDL